MNNTNNDAVNEEADVAASTASPDVRVVKGSPSDEELAALVAVLTASQGGSAEAGDPRPPELWGSPQSLHRRFAPQSAYSYAASGRHKG